MKNNRIKELREKNKFTLKEVAKGAGIDFTTLSKYENGVVKTGKLETWKKLAAFFKVDIPYLQGYDSRADATIDHLKNSQIDTILNKLNVMYNQQYDSSYDRKVFDALNVILDIYTKYEKNTLIIDRLNNVISILEYFNDTINLDVLVSDSTLPDFTDPEYLNTDSDIILEGSNEFKNLLELLDLQKNKEWEN